MGESLRLVHSSNKLEHNKLEQNGIAIKKQPAEYLVACSKVFSQNTSKCMDSMRHSLLPTGAAGDIGLFLLKTAALEVVRRYSTAKCPVVWRGLQALQVLCFPPFKWIQRWGPLKALVKYMQTLSRPLLVLTIATTLSDQSAWTTEESDSLHDSQANSEGQQELSSQFSNSDSRSCDQVPQSIATETWLQELQEELKRQGLTLPERVNEYVLRRFYAAANGDFSRLLSSIKKTILWRQTYTFLSAKELEAWSSWVFWHGYDVELRPCLIIRLGHACSSLRSNNRPLFVKAVVSQIEHRLMRLVDAENPQVTVLMDCEGLSPFGFPVHMMRSCAILLQDHYPNCLGYLIVVRLPRVARLITQALFQVLKPATRKKLRIVGENHQQVLLEYLQTLPSFLGGKCTCSNCSGRVDMHSMNEEILLMRPCGHLVNDVDVPSPTARSLMATWVNPNSGQQMRVAIVGILMAWILVAFILARHYPEYVPLFYWQGGS